MPLPKTAARPHRTGDVVGSKHRRRGDRIGIVILLLAVYLVSQPVSSASSTSVGLPILEYAPFSGGHAFHRAAPFANNCGATAKATSPSSFNNMTGIGQFGANATIRACRGISTNAQVLDVVGEKQALSYTPIANVSANFSAEWNASFNWSIRASGLPGPASLGYLIRVSAMVCVSSKQSAPQCFHDLILLREDHTNVSLARSLQKMVVVATGPLNLVSGVTYHFTTEVRCWVEVGIGSQPAGAYVTSEINAYSPTRQFELDWIRLT
jgi:hypothetical protein